MDEEYIKLLQQQAAAGSEMAIFQLQQLGYDARIPDADASHLTFEAIFPYAKTLRLGMAPIRAYNAAKFLDVASYKNVIRWAEEIAERPAFKRGTRVNRAPSGPEDSAIIERHDSSDLD